MGKNPTYDKNGLKKGPWTADEDEKLIDYIRKHGHGRWKTVPKNAGLERCGKSCRLRWTNYLRPDIKRGRFTFEEEEIIIQLHSILGNKWSAIAARLPGRTDNEIKNYWNTHIRKRLLRMGIDPVTHSPRLDLLHLYFILNSCLGNSPQPNNFQNLSGILQPSALITNPNLLNVITNSLFSSSQCKLLQSWPQNSQYPHDQNHFQQTFINNSVLEQYPEALMETSREGEGAGPSSPPLPYLFQHFSDVERSLVSASDRHIIDGSNQSFVELLCGSQNLRSMNTNNIKSPDFGFGSAISTPTSQSTPLHSSTYSTFVSASTEEERDCNCSMLEIIPKNLDMVSFM